MLATLFINERLVYRCSVTPCIQNHSTLNLWLPRNVHFGLNCLVCYGSFHTEMAMSCSFLTYQHMITCFVTVAASYIISVLFHLIPFSKTLKTPLIHNYNLSSFIFVSYFSTVITLVFTKSERT